MNQLTPITDSLFVLPVPVDANDYTIHCIGGITKIVFSSSLQDPINCGGDMIKIYDKEADFKFLGEVTKDTISFDVERFVDKEFDTYRNYQFEDEIGSYVFTNKNDSFISLLIAKGIKLLPDTKLIVLELLK